MIKSATFKLTLWYLGIIMLLSGLFSMALYRESSAQINDNAARQRNQISRLALPRELEPRRAEVLVGLNAQRLADEQRIMLRLLVLNIATLVVGGAASYALARRTLRPIEDSLEAQGRFTADASHELRTPLTAMRAEIEVALRQKQLSPAEAKELLASNLEEIAKLESLSAGLLRLARSESGLDPAAIKPVPVKELFAAATARFEKVIAERKVTVAVRAGAQTVAGDRDSLVELIAILLDNALKYSPPESTITLTGSSSNHAVRLSVADEGSGIAPKDIPHIFDRFYRADRSRSKDSVEGYGLGLSIAKRIADLHHGTITAENAPTGGAVFKVKLPAQYVAKKSIFDLT